MIFLSSLWAISYGWFEGTVNIGQVVSKIPYLTIPYIGHFSVYHIVLGLMVFAISFSFGLLKFTRMLFARKRYMMFTALGNYTYALALEDFSYFLFAGYDRLDIKTWTCSILDLGCFELKFPWQYNVTFVLPRWYLVAFGFSAAMFFLAYRSALVNLLVTQEVMKQIGFTEKTRLATVQTPAAQESQEQTPSPSISPEPVAKPEVSAIVDADREELVRRLRERLIHQRV